MGARAEGRRVSGRLLASCLLLTVLLPARVAAQLGEVRIGAIGSYAVSDAYRSGVGLTLGYAPGRLAYMGVRWVYYVGSTEALVDNAGSYDITNRTQLFGADLGLEFPLGSMELVVGGTLGAVRYSQHTEPTGASTSGSESASATEFVAAPMAILHIRIGPIMVAPQVAYYFAGSPDLRWSVGGSGPALSCAVILPIETDRIRY
jgi:hypothetical protein